MPRGKRNRGVELPLPQATGGSSGMALGGGAWPSTILPLGENSIASATVCGATLRALCATRSSQTAAANSGSRVATVVEPLQQLDARSACFRRREVPQRQNVDTASGVPPAVEAAPLEKEITVVGLGVAAEAQRKSIHMLTTMLSNAVEEQARELLPMQGEQLESACGLGIWFGVDPSMLRDYVTTSRRRLGASPSVSLSPQ